MCRGIQQEENLFLFLWRVEQREDHFLELFAKKLCSLQITGYIKNTRDPELLRYHRLHQKHERPSRTIPLSPATSKTREDHSVAERRAKSTLATRTLYHEHFFPFHSIHLSHHKDDGPTRLVTFSSSKFQFIRCRGAQNPLSPSRGAVRVLLVRQSLLVLQVQGSLSTPGHRCREPGSREPTNTLRGRARSKDTRGTFLSPSDPCRP